MAADRSGLMERPAVKILSAVRAFSPRLPHYLFAAVLILRLLALARLSASHLLLPTRGDMQFYNDWAHRILDGELGGRTAFYGLPLYAYFLAFLYKTVGYGPYVPGLLQSLLDAGTAVLIYELCLQLFWNEIRTQNVSDSSRAPAVSKLFGATAALGWAFYVPAQAYSIILMPTAWLVFIFWFVVWRIAKSKKAPSWRECLFLGLLIGISAMAVATILFLIPLILGALLLRRGQEMKRGFLLGTACLLFGVGVGTSPCWIHNYFTARDPVVLSAHSGVNFWIGNNPSANGYPRFPPGLRAGQMAMLEDSISTAETAMGRPLKRSEVSAYWSGQARNYISHHFVEWLGLLLVKLRNFWSAFQYDDLSIITNLREQGVIFPGLYFGVVAAFAIPGIWLALRASPPSRWIVAAILLHMMALLPVFVTERYRLPAVPGLLVLDAFGLSIFWRSCLSADYRKTALYLGTLAGATVCISWPQRAPSLWALDAYNSGWQALESGNLALAENKLLLARSYVPTNAETNFALGNLRLAQGDNQAAFSFYQATLKFDQDHRGALNNLSVMALDASRYELAEKWLRRAENIDPHNAKTHFLLAKALLGQGSRDAAQLEIDTALRLRPDQNEFQQLRQQIETTR